jgi:hypothetical protein
LAVAAGLAHQDGDDPDKAEEDEEAVGPKRITGEGGDGKLGGGEEAAVGDDGRDGHVGRGGVDDLVEAEEDPGFVETQG